MPTQLMIMAIAFAAVTAAIGVVALLVLTLGWLGLAMGALGTTMILVVYRRWIQPWQHRWGATDQEAHRAMPGDDRIPDAASTTRAIAIAAPPEQVWPWLMQLGYGRRLVQLRLNRQRRPAQRRPPPQLQQLQLGDQILMAPETGLIRELQPNRHFVAGDQEGGSWCLALYPTPDGCRLVRRWRARWPMTLATAFWILLSDPGAFIMNASCSRASRLVPSGPSTPPRNPLRPRRGPER